ncbi:methyltransferase [Gluconobacter albidus]|uniref:class I SAM-dependent methyltransferase n=1 Tax=Gluconobacter albidus TaxID=318683 RepID=UPI00098B5538|nr:methyltransferase domain-containing protein [Gluconobacter albidus]AQS89708.1 methyltransferase [Gluconobacter albidus]MCP1274395.1 methyltransferase domain-containing protein [Gluconobacter albidus]
MKAVYPVICALTMLASGPALRAADLNQAIQSTSRDERFVARDPVRHPLEELQFFGLRPDTNVVEIWPGGGYWTQILGPYLHDKGTYTLALGPEDKPGSAFSKMLAAHPALEGSFRTTQFDAGHLDFAPADSADLVLTFRNLHNWMEAGNAPQMLAAIHRVLKPGGIFGVEDHRGHTTAPQDPSAKDGYVRQSYAIGLIEKAGFRLVGSSEINANPKDTANWPKGVWTLPPTFALKDRDHAKYAAIGEGDNFVLKFEKIAH